MTLKSINDSILMQLCIRTRLYFFRKQLLAESAPLNLTNTLSQTFMDIL